MLGQKPLLKSSFIQQRRSALHAGLGVQNCTEPVWQHSAPRSWRKLSATATTSIRLKSFATAKSSSPRGASADACCVVRVGKYLKTAPLACAVAPSSHARPCYGVSLLHSPSGWVLITNHRGTRPRRRVRGWQAPKTGSYPVPQTTASTAVEILLSARKAARDLPPFQRVRIRVRHLFR